MPRKSVTDNVRKICGCTRWKTCPHPWYLDFQRKNVRYRDNLDQLIDRHPADFNEAKDEARRAIVAKLAGRDPRELLPGDGPTIATLLDAYRRRAGAAVHDITEQRGPLLQVIVGGRPFGEWRAAAVTRDALEAFRRQRSLVAGNRNLALLRAMFNWAVLGELVPATPFKVGGVSAVKLAHEEPRIRRLEPGEEAQLLTHARGLLRDLIPAALETGCRIGELLSLQWHQVRGELFLPGGKTKSKKPRRVPISTVLRRLLEARRLDPAGEPLPPAAFVFGDEIGRPRRSPLTTAWENVVLKAHGVPPVRTRRGKLAPECRVRLREINLHFHDLRREAGSRWMDAGVPLAIIQRWLGHHNISQTSTYLAASGGGDADAMRAFEQARGRLTQIDVFGGPNGPKPTAPDSAPIEKTQLNRVVH